MTTPVEPIASDFHEKLAAQLLECSLLVKKGQRGPILRQTVHDLTDYLTMANGVSSTSNTPTTTPTKATKKTVTRTTTTTTTHRPAGDPPATPRKGAAGGSGSDAHRSAKPAAPQAAAAQDTVTKPTKPPHFGQVLGKMMGMTGDVSHEPQTRSDASKRATSQKNANRLMEELAAEEKEKKQGGGWFGSVGSHDESAEWCEEHFTMGCACKTRKQQDVADRAEQPAAAAAAAASSGSTGDKKATRIVTKTVTTTTVKAPPPPKASSGDASTQSSGSGGKGKPAFARPVNPKSSLIANGWIQQQRRSKMRHAWKEVLASVVEGRRPGEETTLWIQREVINQNTNKAELEALHQIPVKWIEKVHFMEYSTDNQFSIKVFNITDDFIFRCPNDTDAAQNWVLTLRSIQQISQKNRVKATTGVDDWDSTDQAKMPASPQQNKSFEEEKKAPDMAYPQPQQQAPHGGHRMSVKELRAIAHGAGISTHGMERGELEAVVAQIAASAAGAAPQGAAGAHPSPDRKPTRPTEEETRRMQQEEMERRRKLEEVRRRRLAEEEERAKRQVQEDERKRQHEEQERQRRLAESVREKQALEQKRRAEEERKKEEERQRLMAERVREQHAMEKRKREEEERRRLAEERKRRDDEEIRRRAAERQAAEQRRKLEEAQRQQQQQWQQQQQQWQSQQAQDDQRRRMADMQAAEARRQQEEALRRQQQWHQQQQRPQGAYPQQQNAPFTGPAPPVQQNPHAARPGYSGQPNAYGNSGHQTPPPPPHGNAHGPPPPHGSPINAKYAKMAQQKDAGGEAAITNIKHGILIQWALLPPMLQVLRPIEDLITSIHGVFPPKFGVPGHEYFSRWAAVKYEDISQGPAMGNRPDDAKLKKVMRKLRFFLHPDKLPRDLSKEQTFMCKMLWDIISDAEAEHKKREEELGWIRG